MGHGPSDGGLGDLGYGVVGHRVHSHGNHGHGDGVHEEGVHGDGVHEEGAHGDGVHEEGAHGDGVHEEGVHGDGVHEEDVLGDDAHWNYDYLRVHGPHWCLKRPMMEKLLLEMVDCLSDFCLLEEVGTQIYVACGNHGDLEIYRAYVEACQQENAHARQSGSDGPNASAHH